MEMRPWPVQPSGLTICAASIHGICCKSSNGTPKLKHVNVSATFTRDEGLMTASSRRECFVSTSCCAPCTQGYKRMAGLRPTCTEGDCTAAPLAIMGVPRTGERLAASWLYFTACEPRESPLAMLPMSLGAQKKGLPPATERLRAPLHQASSFVEESVLHVPPPRGAMDSECHSFKVHCVIA